MYIQVDKLIPKLVPEDYEKDEKQRSVTLTEQGSQRIEDLLDDSGILQSGSLYDVQNISIVHHANQALRAHTLFSRDTDYIVKDGKVVIIDEFTGRMMEGRRYSDGLHQALEAKEGVEVQTENQTLASITFQNYFRLYPKLAGMTGTAMTEAAEFAEIYSLEVVDMPTNMPMIRLDEDDEIYRTQTEKHNAILEQVAECQWTGPARPGRNGKHREVGRTVGLADQAEDEARSAERATSRTGSAYHRRCRHAGRDHDCDQHGGPRHGHPIRRQSRNASLARARRRYG